MFFIIVYTVISTYPTPCPDKFPPNWACAVYHGMTTDTSMVEVMTTDTSMVNKTLRDHPGANVDTFLLTPFIRG